MHVTTQYGGSLGANLQKLGDFSKESAKDEFVPSSNDSVADTPGLASGIVENETV